MLELDHDGEPLTVVGELSSVGEGEVLTLHGSFRTHPATAPSLRRWLPNSSCRPPPRPSCGILASGAIKGIGPVLASRMVAQLATTP